MYIYTTINRVNGRKYIGRDSKRRPGYLGSGTLLRQAIRRYGRDNFERINLEECSTLRELIDRERFWIDFYDAVKSEEFYNMSEGTGGFGPNDKHSEETKRRISEKCRGRKLTSEQRERRIETLKGREPWNKNRILDRNSEEYQKTYLNRKLGKKPDLATMVNILSDYETGEFTFAELSAKYGRTVKNAQILRYRKEVEASTRGAGSSTDH